MDINIPRVKPPQNLLEFCIKGDIRAIDDESKKEGVNPNMQDQEGNTPLILATQAGYTSIVELLLERFPTLNIDQVNNIGQSALMKAAIQGRISCARVLLRAGADPNLRDFSRGFCALEWAEYVGRTECMHMIAHYMLQPIKPKKKTCVAIFEDLQKLTAVATVPLLGDSADSVVPHPRPRVGSAPIPRLEITVAPEQVRKHSYGYQTSKRRPHSSMS
uniref:ANK_REP_REGION domain-containing protein n=1 Tax=Heterorhabditis bacteriophora TaxID=37862 RepID=A0A1I7WS06_HETBA